MLLDSTEILHLCRNTLLRANMDAISATKYHVIQLNYISSISEKLVQCVDLLNSLDIVPVSIQITPKLTEQRFQDVLQLFTKNTAVDDKQTLGQTLFLIKEIQNHISKYLLELRNPTSRGKLF